MIAPILLHHKPDAHPNRVRTARHAAVRPFARSGAVRDLLRAAAAPAVVPRAGWCKNYTAEMEEHIKALEDSWGGPTHSAVPEDQALLPFVH